MAGGVEDNATVTGISAGDFTSGVSAASSETLPEGTQLGSYTISRLIGKGGMGAVYEAEHRELGKRSAIKTLLPEHAAKADIRARFLREGRAASKIHHANVVDVFDVGEMGELPFLVMEYLDGEDLASLLAREHRLSAQTAVDYLLPICAALAAAHSMDIVHRDLKPENIFLCHGRGGRIEPKLVDFGISKILTQGEKGGLTGTSALMGTPYYMSPEQAKSAKNIDARSDQFSFGAILYEALVGHRPFQGDSLYAILDAIVRGNYPKPREVHEDIPPELESTILRAMAERAEDRFPSMRALGRELLPRASSRTQALYEEEFSVEGNAKSHRPPAVTNPGDRALSTLRDSAASMNTQPATTSRTPIVAAVAVLLVVLGGGGAWWASTGSKTDQPATGMVEPTPFAPASTQAATAAASSEPPPADSMVATAAAPVLLTKTIESKPAADVYLDGKKVGTTPYRMEMKPEAEPVEVELRAAGHLPTAQRISPTDDDTVAVVLKPRPARPSGPPPLAPR